ncbi:MAG: peptidylprolyl isomerase [Thermoplasmata archaeon]|nr:MAG: peptidylprolyl isomerase [Thermoplasmata archaeon]
MTQAIMDTNKGKIILELFSQDTPNTVANFIKLSEQGFYNGLKFHRVIPNFMIQGGCPKGTGTGGPGYQIDCEIRPHLKHETGTLSMAHAGSCSHDKNTGAKQSGKCSNGSQFFITHEPTPHLDGIHTVFGRVIQGQDVVNAIQQGDVINNSMVQK